MSAVATTESEMKVPPSLAFVENAPVTRSVGVMGADIHSGFGDASMEAPAQYDADDWGYSFNESSFAPTKLSSSDDFNPSKNFGPESLMPSKLSSSDAFNPIKGGNVGFSSPMVFQESVQPRALEPEPIYFEKYSSFVSTSSPSAVLADIANVFAERSNVDHEPCFEKNKIKGVAYESNGRCTFKVRLYQSSSPGSILCEFQRRSGCVVSFNKFYRRTLADIASHVSKKVGTGNWLSNIERTEVQINEPTVQLDSDAAINLISMAGCDNIDVQREGAQALANVAKFPTNQVKLAEMHMEAPAESRVVGLLQKLLGSVDVELCRSGCVLLSSLATQDCMKSVLTQTLLQQMLVILDAPASFETTNSKRQIALTLSMLAKTGAQEILSHPCGQQCVNVLKKYMRAYDASFQESVLSALGSLQA